MIYQAKDYSGDINENFDVVIIGSGAGGAVAAMELSQYGLSVVVLEEGSYYTYKDYSKWKTYDSFKRIYRDFGLTVALGKSINDPPVPFPLGKVVGGTTVVNSGTMFRLPDKIYGRWKKSSKFSIGEDELNRAFDKVEKITQTAPVSFDIMGKNGLIFKKGADKLNYRNAPLKRNAAGCKGCGRCVFGCPQDAKKAMHVSYLPIAIENGAVVFSNARAEDILVKSGKAYGVAGKILNPTTNEPILNFKITGKIIILAAGAIYTPLILLQNKNLANSSGLVGKNLHLHPGSRAGAMFEERLDGWKGVPQSLYVDQFWDNNIMLEGVFVPPGFASPALPGVSRKHEEIMKRYPYVSNFGVMVSDTSMGEVRRGIKKFKPLIFYKFNEYDKINMVNGLKYMAEIYFAAGAKEVYTAMYPHVHIKTPDDIKKIEPQYIQRKNIELMAFHPMGTVKLGKDPKYSVVDENLETHDIENLFVMDGSVFPSCLGVNPQETIMAFATYASWRVINNWEKYK